MIEKITLIEINLDTQFYFMYFLIQRTTGIDLKYIRIVFECRVNFQNVTKVKKTIREDNDWIIFP